MRRSCIPVFISMIVLCLVSQALARTSGTAEENFSSESGFITIKPVSYDWNPGTYFYRLPLKTSEARMWYTFIPADVDPAAKPLFMFFNGGPGSATSCGLMSLNTGKQTLDTTQPRGGDCFIPNPVSWTRLGNLLYVDARQTGFSYCLMDNPQDEAARVREFNLQNFNLYIDAADFIRVLLDFFEKHPRLRTNRVVLVGESFGGIRATMMLELLLSYRDYKTPHRYKEGLADPGLVNIIQNHYDQVFPQYAGGIVPKEVIARQFSHQILIQPVISIPYQDEIAGEMIEQKGSFIYQIAREEGVPFVPSHERSDGIDPISNVRQFLYDVGRDAYCYSKPFDWMDGFFDRAAEMLQKTVNLKRLTGYPVGQIGGLYARNRARAYRIKFFEGTLVSGIPANQRTQDSPDNDGVTIPPDLEKVFGILKPWDGYYFSHNRYSSQGFGYNILGYTYFIGQYYYSNWYGNYFLYNVEYVNTFVTNATHDTVIYSAAIPETLKRFDYIASEVEYIKNKVDGEPRPGRIVLHYKYPSTTAAFREIRFPAYEGSAHCVPIIHGVEFFEDVSEWLKETGGNNEE